MARILKKNYLSLFFIVTAIIVMILIGKLIPEQEIRNIIQNSGAWGVLLLIFFLWITNVVAPLSGSPFLYAGFYSYGQMSVIYAFIAAVIASITNFWIAKLWGRKIVIKLAGEDNIEKIDGLTKNYGLTTLFVFRLFLKEFHDVISYVFGLTNLNFKSYFFVSTLGMIPATAIWYIISLKIHDPLVFTTISWIFAYITVSFYLIFIKIRKNKKTIEK